MEKVSERWRTLKNCPHCLGKKEICQINLKDFLHGSLHKLQTLCKEYLCNKMLETLY